VKPIHSIHYSIATFLKFLERNSKNYYFYIIRGGDDIYEGKSKEQLICANRLIAHLPELLYDDFNMMSLTKSSGKELIKL